MRKQPGRVKLVKNKKRKPAANADYYQAKVILGKNDERIILLTYYEMWRALRRAKRNPEDKR